MVEQIPAEIPISGYVAPVLTVIGRRSSRLASRRGPDLPNVIDLPPLAAHASPPQWSPSINVFDTGGAFVVIAELAGVGPDSLRIELDTSRDRLTLRGTRRTATQGQSMDEEITSGAFERSIAFDTPVDAEGARAICRYGLLELFVPKAPQRRIIDAPTVSRATAC